MLGLPQAGELVTFQCAAGRRVPMVGRKGFYEPGKDYEERWSQQHYARLLDGSIALVRWVDMPKGNTAEKAKAEEAAG